MTITWRRLDLRSGRLVLHSPTPTPQMKEAGGTLRDGAWSFPPLAVYASIATEMLPGLEAVNGASSLLEGWGFHHRELDVDAIDEWSPSLASRIRTLYPFQREAVEYLLSSPHDGSLLALSPGLGKSAVALISAELAHEDPMKVLIIAPLSLLRNWEREIETWSDHEVSRRHGQPPGEESWTLTNYETVVHQQAYQRVNWDLVILDESILVKNRDTKRFKALKLLRLRTRKIWLLSGSPTSRYADDLWTQLHLINPQAFRSYWRFTQRYCYVEISPWGSSVTGTREDRDLQGDLRDLMFVRNQKDVLPDLPEFLFQTIEVDLTPEQRRVYGDLLHDFITTLESGDELTVDTKLAQMTRLQQVVSNLVNVDPSSKEQSSKLDALCDLVSTGEIPFPAIVWSHWVPGAEATAQRLALMGIRVGVVNGHHKPTDNEATLELYKSGGLDILVLSATIGKYGHTLTSTQTMVYLDKTWNADDYVQSLHRVQRIGLDHRPLVVTIKATGTIDELVESNLSGKMVSISKVTNADLAKLLKGLGR